MRPELAHFLLVLEEELHEHREQFLRGKLELCHHVPPLDHVQPMLEEYRALVL